MTRLTKRPTRIMLDVDEVVCDFVGHYLTLAGKLLDREFKKEQVKAWSIADSLDLPVWAKRELQYEFSRPGAALKLDLIPGSREAYQELKSIAEIHFVTSPFEGSQTWGSDRVEWLKHYFGEDVNWHLTKHKYVVQADAMVDDKAEFCEDWANQNPGFVVIWDSPWNKSLELPNSLRTNSWDVAIPAIKTALNGRSKA